MMYPVVRFDVYDPDTGSPITIECEPGECTYDDTTKVCYGKIPGIAITFANAPPLGGAGAGNGGGGGGGGGNGGGGGGASPGR